MVKISVITVVFNGAKYLQNCIDSVFNQSYKYIEHIIIDGKSTDNTIEVLRLNESKIAKWISEKDNGLADAMNKGSALATGNYIVYLHADDTFYNNTSVESVVQLIEQHSFPNWITGFYEYKNSQNDVFKSDEPKEYSFVSMLLRNIIRHQATFVKTELVKQIQFSSRYKYAMDYDFFLKLWNKKNPPIYYLGYLAFFRLDGKNLSSNYFKSMQDELEARKAYRMKTNFLYLPFDYFVYFLRYLKLIFIHLPKNKKNVR